MKLDVKVTVKGLFWSFADNLLQQIVNFVVGIILARILLPEEFGILGIITVFIALSNTFVNSGLSDALINNKDSTASDFHTVFWANVLLGMVTYLLLFFLAPVIANFYEQESLTYLVRLTAISVILVSFSSIQRTILVKKINFKIITIVSIVSVILSGIVAVYMALSGYGILSLIVRMVLGQLITMILFWSFNKWRPKLIFDFTAFKKMYSYGVNLFFARLVNSLYDNLYYLIIGKFFSAASLGYYTRAEMFKNLASTNIINTVQRVSFSVLSSKDNLSERIIIFKQFVLGTFLLTAFLMTVLFTSAKEIVTILLGVKWIPSVTYLKILSISGLFLPSYALNLNYLAVNSRTKLYFKIELCTKLFAIPTIIIGIYFGLVSMLISISVFSFFMYLITTNYIDKLFQYKFKKQIIIVVKGVSLFITSIILIEIIKKSFISNLNVYSAFLVHLLVVILTFFIGIVLMFPNLFEQIKYFKNER